MKRFKKIKLKQRKGFTLFSDRLFFLEALKDIICEIKSPTEVILFPSKNKTKNIQK
jgi:hypothetical protein